MPSNTSVDEHPSMLWVVIPPVLLFAGYYVRKWYLSRRLRLYGIGKGAPGFQTNVRQMRVTPEIAARLRRGEDVSPAEIEAASRKAEMEEEEQRRTGTSGTTSSTGAFNGGAGLGLSRGVLEERDDRHLINGGVEEKEDANEWLPDSITKPSKRKKARK